MNLRWPWLDHFPKGLAISREERGMAKKLARQLERHRRHYRNAFRKHQTRVLPAIIVFIILTMYFHFGSSDWKTIAYVIGHAILFTGIASALHLSRAPYIRRALCVLGHDTCVDCGYILKGLGFDVKQCPECGEKQSDDCPHCGRWIGSLNPTRKQCPECTGVVNARYASWIKLDTIRSLGYDLCRGCGYGHREPVAAMPNCPQCGLSRDLSAHVPDS